MAAKRPLLGALEALLTSVVSDLLSDAGNLIQSTCGMPSITRQDAADVTAVRDGVSEHYALSNISLSSHLPGFATQVNCIVLRLHRGDAYESHLRAVSAADLLRGSSCSGRGSCHR